MLKMLLTENEVQWYCSGAQPDCSPAPLQAAMSKFLTYCVLRTTQPTILYWMGNG